MTSSCRKVLLVDDDADIREVVGSLLQQRGYDMHLAEHGADALTRLESFRPDVILLDIRMPVMDGPEFYRRLRERYGDAVHVVLMSAYTDLAEVAAGLGVANTLEKPFELHDLFGLVERLTAAR